MENIRLCVSFRASSTGSTKGVLVLVGIVFIVACIIIAPSVLGVILTRNPAGKCSYIYFFFTNTIQCVIVTDKTSTTTIAPNVTNVFWSFDSDADDMYGVYNGILQNGAQYASPTYFQLGFYLTLNRTTNDSVIVSSHFLNLTYTSFTIEAWIYASSLNGDNAIFTQCACSTCQDQCLYLLIRNFKLYMSFMMNDVIGLTTLTINTWYHVGFVYDYSSQTQSVYLQGVLDNSKSSAGPYKGGNASIVIGAAPFSDSAFNGYIDNMKVTTRAKSADEMLTVGTTMVYFSFDGPTLAEDMGPNKMNGTISNAAAVTGRVGQGIAFNGAPTSYVQLTGMFQLGQASRPFSFAFWIYPYSINGGTLIQVSSTSNSSGWCYSFMGLNYLGQITMLVYNSQPSVLLGPILPVRTWTHLAETYSNTNGVQMYINGVLYARSAPVTRSASNQNDYLNFGSYVNTYCGPGSNSIYPIAYNGIIDEFYVYRRELSAADVYALANP